MGYDYYSYAYSGTEDMAAFGGLIVVLILFYVLMMAFSVVCYVLQALGMYSIAKRRGIHKPWLAWIPVVNMWLLGSISDQYQYVVKGKVRNRRKVLLGLNIALYAMLILVYASAIALPFLGNGAAALGGTVLLMVLCALAMLVLSVLMVVWQYIALYDLYASCDPGNAVLYLVLSILVNVTMPFFIFACRKKDLGMPQRKPAPEPVIPAPFVIPEPVQEEPVPQAFSGDAGEAESSANDL